MRCRASEQLEQSQSGQSAQQLLAEEGEALLVRVVRREDGSLGLEITVANETVVAALCRGERSEK